METPLADPPPVGPDDPNKFDLNGRRPAERIVRWVIKGALIVFNALFGGEYGGGK